MEKIRYEGLNVTLIHRLKKKIEELNEEKEKYSALFERSNDAIVLITTDGRIFGLNKKFEEITGFAEKEIIDKPLIEALKTKSTEKSRNKEMFMECLKQEEIDFDTNAISKRGELRDINIKAKVLKIKGASFVQAIVRDITEKKRAEEKMLYFQKAVESSSDAIGMSTPEGKHYYQNEAFNKLFGLNVKEIEGKEGPPSTVYADKKVGRKVFKTIMMGSPWIGEVEMLSKSRGKILIFLRAYSIKDEQGKIIGLIGVHNDITERKKAEQALRESEKKYRTLLENLPQKIFFKDRNSVYISCNENYARDLKIKPDKIKGKADYDFYPKKLAEKYRADDRRIMKAGKARDIEEEYIQDGKKVFVHTVKVPVKDEKGNVMGILGIFWDITEKKKAEDALRKNERTCSKLVKRLKEVKK